MRLISRLPRAKYHFLLPTDIDQGPFNVSDTVLGVGLRELCAFDLTLNSARHSEVDTGRGKD